MVRYDTTTKRLYLCDGAEWVQLRGARDLRAAERIACGQTITNDCGDLCSGPGSRSTSPSARRTPRRRPVRRSRTGVTTPVG